MESKCDDSFEQGGLDDDDDLTIAVVCVKSNKSFDVPRSACVMSALMKTMMACDQTVTEIPVFHIDSDTLEDILTYMIHHDGKHYQKQIKLPLTSTNIGDLVQDKFDVNLLNTFNVFGIQKLLSVRNMIHYIPYTLLHHTHYYVVFYQ